MRIGFDVSQTGTAKAGCGFYAEGLIRALAEADCENEYILYPTFGDHFYDSQIHCEDLARFRNVQLGPHQGHLEAKRFWAHPSPTFESDLGQPDIIHANNFFAPNGLSHARLVYTLYDLSFLEDCSWTTESNRTGCFEGMFRASVSADWLVAISHYSKERFLHTFPHYPADRISVVYPASRFGDGYPTEETPSVKLERRKFWLCVGTLEPRKNYPAILAAYAELRQKVGRTHPLVIVGGTGWMMNSIESEIKRLELDGSVIRLGYAKDGVLSWLYRNATALVFPSLYEGFGMPVLEAMSCGTPAIAGSGSAFLEIAPRTGYAELLVDPLSSSSICNAMCLVNAMLPGDLDTLGAIAKERAREFSWEASAEALLAVYRQVAAMPRLFSA